MSIDQGPVIEEGLLRPQARQEVASAIVRRVLVQAEEAFLADPSFTLGTWVTRVQETISVASAVTLEGIDERRCLADDAVATELMGVYADICAEAIRAAARLSPFPTSDDPKEHLLAIASGQDNAIASMTAWSDLKDALIRCQAAMEPIANGLREGDLPMTIASDPDGVVYSTFTKVIGYAYGVVCALCLVPDQRPALTSGTAGASVRVASGRTYLKAGGKTLKAGLLVLLAGIGVARGAPAVATVILILAGIAARRAWTLRGSAENHRLGAIGEEGVAGVLLELTAPWQVEHDVAKAGGGNIDHLVHSPAAIFSIDTKLSRAREKDFAQARRHAAWVAGEYGTAKAIVPVICVYRSDMPAGLAGGVWVVGASQLVGFLLRWESAPETFFPALD